MPTRAILFARVSKDEHAQTTASQLLALRDVASRLGWEVAAEVPLELSAWNDKTAREVRRVALSAVRDHRANVLAVWALDRVCRSGIAPAHALLGELEHHLGASFYSYSEPFLSTATADPNMRPLMLSLFAWMASEESRRKSDRIRAKVASKRAHSAKLGHRATWGRGHLPSDADRARVQALRADGQSLRAIEAETGIPRSTVARIVGD